jgi:hypothetical protein
MPAADVSEELTPALFAGAQRRFGVMALDELPDLAADRRQRRELLFVAFPSCAAEELDNPEGFGIEEDRENDASMQPRSRRRRGAQEFGVGRSIDHPDR